MGGLTSGAGAGGEAFTGAGVCVEGAFTGIGAMKQDTWQSLHDLIILKRYRAWQKAREKIMFNSLEEVIKQFMDLSTKKAEAARSQAQALEEALDVDNLEARKSDIELCQR
ncbi:hypothetical protein AgCh_017262 [Apium graveolens]